MVFRPVGNHFEVVTEAYMPEIIHGGAMKGLHEGKFPLPEFELH
jgi:hypothetical protein